MKRPKAMTLTIRTTLGDRIGERDHDEKDKTI